VVSPTTGDDPDEDEWKKSSKKEWKHRAALFICSRIQ
jgi:hypothetical protein